MSNPTGNELVACIGVASGGGPAATTEYFTTQQIANLGSGGGEETIRTISTGGSHTVHTPAPGSPTNVIVTTTSAVTINIDAPNGTTPTGRVNITDQSGDPYITVVPASGEINGASSATLNIPYESNDLLDFGTGWAIQ